MKYKRTYTLVDELMASATRPIQAERARHQLTAMWSGLAALETAPVAEPNDWRLVSDAINMMGTFCAVGNWRDCDGDITVVSDRSGLLPDAMRAMGEAGERAMRGLPLRLSGAGIQAVRAVLEDYAAVLDVLPERAVVSAHRKTEKRLLAILAGRKLPHDVRVAV